MKKTALDVSNEPYVSEKRKSVIKPEDFLLQWASRVQLGAQILYILSLCLFVILNEALEQYPSSDSCVRVRARDLYVCNRVYTLIKKNCAPPRYDGTTRSSKNGRFRDSRPRKLGHFEISKFPGF